MSQRLRKLAENIFGLDEDGERTSPDALPGPQPDRIRKSHLVVTAYNFVRMAKLTGGAGRVPGLSGLNSILAVGRGASPG